MAHDIDSAIDKLLAEMDALPNVVPLPNDQFIAEYESETGFKFPEEYRKLLMRANNVVAGYLEPLVISPGRDARGELLTAIGEGRAAGVPTDWLPICEDNGDYYCLDLEARVRFWSHDGSTDESWPDLATWIIDVWLGDD